MTARTPASPRPSVSWSVLAVVVVIGAAAVSASWVQEERSAAARQRASLDGFAESADAAATNAVAALAGSAALVDLDGDVSAERLELLVDDLAMDSHLRAVGLVSVVAGADRDRVEAELGRSIVQLDDDGITVAPTRLEHWVLRSVSPQDDLTSALVGLDLVGTEIASGPASRARDSGRTLITPAVQLESDAPRGELLDPAEEPTLVFVLKPLYTPGEPSDTVEQRRTNHVGFLVSAITGDQLGDALSSAVPDGAIYRISDGDVVVASSGEPSPGSPERTQEVLGQQWLIQVEDPAGADHSFSALLIVVTLFLALVIALAAVRDRRLRRESDRLNAMVDRTAVLAQRLSAAATAREVAEVIGEDLPLIFDAQAASFGEVDRSAGVVRLHYGPTMDPALAALYPDYPLHRPAPVTTSVRTAEMVLVPGDHAWARVVPKEVSDDIRRAGIRAMASLPLAGRDDSVVATLGLFWNRSVSFDPVTVAIMGTVVELCEQTLARAAATDRRTADAAALARLGERLAAAATLDEVTEMVVEHAKAPVLASAVSIGLVDEASETLRVTHGSDVGSELAARYANPPLSAPLAFTEAARTGQPIYIDTFAEYRERYPATHPSQADLGRGSRASLPLVVGGSSIGAVVFAWDRDRVFDEELLFRLSTIAELTAQAVNRTRLTARRLEEAARSSALARFAQGLSTCRHRSDVAALSAAHVGGVIDVQWCALAFPEADGLRLVGPGASDRLRPYTHDGDRPEDSGGDPSGAAGRSRRGAAEEPLARRALEALAGESGEHATANWSTLVLRDRDDAPLGVLLLGRTDAQPHDGAVADLLSTLVGVIQQSMERAGLTDRLLADASRNEELARFTGLVADARSVAELCQVVRESACAPVGAVVAGVGLLDESGEHLLVDPHPYFDAEVVGWFAERRITDRLPGVEAVRTGRTVLVPSAAEASERYPGRYADALSRHGLGATAHLPMVAADGAPIGCVGFAWDRQRDFGPGDLAMLSTITEVCAQAVERTRLAETEHRLIQNLHRRVVDESPSPEGVDLATRYLPSTAQVGLGGDWYDTMPLGQDTYAVVVGDVAGHGINAVADMIELRAVISAELLNGRPIGEVLPVVSAWLGRTDSIATACVTVIDSGAGRVEHVSAGHLPPVLLAPDGTARLLEGGRQPILGVPGAPVEPEVAPFPAGSVLVVCTDGLIERRDRSIDASLEELVSSVGRAAGDGVRAEALADELLADLLGGEPNEDDVALVVVQRPAATTSLLDRPLGDPARDAEDPSGRSRSLRLDPEAASAASARAFVTDAVRSDPAAHGDLTLVVSELATNAVRHAGTEFWVRVDQDDDAVRLAVFDRGDGIPHVVDPGPDTVGGRGMRLVDQLSTQWGVTRGEDGKWVWSVMRVSSTTLSDRSVGLD